MPGGLLSSAFLAVTAPDDPGIIFAGRRRFLAEALFTPNPRLQNAHRINIAFAKRGDPASNSGVESDDVDPVGTVPADDGADVQPSSGQDDEDGAEGSGEADPDAEDAQREPGAVAADARGPGRYPGWENTEGLPTVTVASPSDTYFSQDIADAGDEGAFSPSLGCKCGAWRPAPSHPSLEFRRSFLEGHPDFLKRLRFLKVNMAETQPFQAVHWDATYDLKRFLSTADVASGKVKLPDSLPAVAGGGTQRRFMTFCPPEAGPAHTYSLKVTALDAQGKAIEYFKDKLSTIVAEPPASQAGQTFPSDSDEPRSLETPLHSAVGS